jgi:hypothetical protein
MKVIQTILYADDQVIIAKSENELQMAVNKLHKIAKKYDMKISTSKTKAIGVCGKNIQRVKIEIEGKIIEQVSNFNYLGSLISYEGKDINAKLQIYNKMNGIIKRHFRKQMTTDTKLRLHNITSKARLCYGSETWTINVHYDDDTRKLFVFILLKLCSMVCTEFLLENMTLKTLKYITVGTYRGIIFK